MPGDITMPVTVNEALKLEVFNKCRLLTGEAGMQNEIEWVNILEILDDLSHIEPGELLITTAHDFNLQSAEKLQGMIELFAARKLAAVAIQTGYYLKNIPETFIRFAMEKNIPLIEIPQDVSFKSLTRVLLNRLIHDQREDDHDLIRDGSSNWLEEQIKSMQLLWDKLDSSDNPGELHLDLLKFGIDPREPTEIIDIYLPGPDQEHDNPDSDQRADLYKKVVPLIIRKLRQFDFSLIVGPSDQFMVLLVQSNKRDKIRNKLLKESLNKLLPDLKVYFPGLNPIAGISNSHSDITSFNIALDEAAKALQAARLKLVYPKNIVSYQELGLYRLIMDIKNVETLKNIYEETTSPLLNYDNSCDGSLLNTLQQYLETCSIKKASELLYVHRHTMKYRLEQVHKLTGLNPLCPVDALQLNIGLHIYRYLIALNLLS